MVSEVGALFAVLGPLEPLAVSTAVITTLVVPAVPPAGVPLTRQLLVLPGSTATLSPVGRPVAVQLVSG